MVMGKTRSGFRFYIILALCAAAAISLYFGLPAISDNAASGTKVCPSSCFLYNGSGGPAGNIEVDCVVSGRNVGANLAVCAGKESYNGQRDRICSCAPVKTE